MFIGSAIVGGGDVIQGGGTPISGPVAIPPPETVTAQSIPAITGTDPGELASATYGKIIPVWALGIARIGGYIIFGPIFSIRADGVKLVSFGVSFGYIANPEGTRAVYEIAFDSKVVWNSEDGALAEWLVHRFNPGSLTQSPDALEVTENGDAATAHRGQMTMYFDDVPYEQFNYKVPFVSAVIGDTTDGADPLDGLLLGEALERLAYSPIVDYTSDEFVTEGITDVIQAMGVAVDLTFMALCQTIVRVYRTLAIVQDEKLKVIDWGSKQTADITLDNTQLVASDVGCLVVTRGAQVHIPREQGLTFINPAIDYQYDNVTAKRPRDPVPITAAVGREDIEIPLVIFKQNAIALITYAVYAEEVAREKVQGAALPTAGIEIRPGKVLDANDGYEDYTVLVTETVRGPNLVTQFTGDAILKCAIEIPPEEPYEAGAVHFDGVTFLARGGDLTGVADSSTFIFAVWLHDIGVGDPQTIAHTGSNYNFYIDRDAAGIFAVIYNAADPTNLSVAFGRNPPPDFDAATWTSVIFCADVSTTIGNPDQTNLQVLIDGVVVDPGNFGQSGDPPSGFTIGFSSNEANFFIGDSYEGDMAELYFAPGQWLDFSDIDNVRKFITAGGKPADLGADGATPTGTAPAVYMRGGASTFATNLGSGGAFTTDGTLTDAATSPSD